MLISGNISVDDIMLPTYRYIYVAYSVVYILLLPVFIFIICVGFQQCRKPRSRSSTTTDSDVFTFHMAALEVFVVVSSVFLLSAHFGGHGFDVGGSLSSMTTFGQTLFHLLVCLERYLAVVHPITYLHLKQKGVVMRNLSIGVVWFFSCCVVCADFLNPNVPIYVHLITTPLTLMAVSFFCARVLFVLIRPGPGERGGDRRHVDKSKRRAFNTIGAITVALLLKFGAMLAALMVMPQVLNGSHALPIVVCAQWFNIPSSLVLPLPFLYRRFNNGK